MTFTAVSALFTAILGMVGDVLDVIFANEYLAIGAGALIVAGVISLTISVFKKIANARKAA